MTGSRASHESGRFNSVFLHLFDQTTEYCLGALNDIPRIHEMYAGPREPPTPVRRPPATVEKLRRGYTALIDADRTEREAIIAVEGLTALAFQKWPLYMDLPRIDEGRLTPLFMALRGIIETRDEHNDPLLGVPDFRAMARGMIVKIVAMLDLPLRTSFVQVLSVAQAVARGHRRISTMRLEPPPYRTWGTGGVFPSPPLYNRLPGRRPFHSHLDPAVFMRSTIQMGSREHRDWADRVREDVRRYYRLMDKVRHSDAHSAFDVYSVPASTREILIQDYNRALDGKPTTQRAAKRYALAFAQYALNILENSRFPEPFFTIAPNVWEIVNHNVAFVNHAYVEVIEPRVSFIDHLPRVRPHFERIRDHLLERGPANEPDPARCTATQSQLLAHLNAELRKILARNDETLTEGTDICEIMSLPRIEAPNDRDCLCRDPIQEGEPVVQLPCNTDHFHHADCIRAALLRDGTCPDCGEMTSRTLHDHFWRRSVIERNGRINDDNDSLEDVPPWPPLVRSGEVIPAKRPATERPPTELPGIVAPSLSRPVKFPRLTDRAAEGLRRIERRVQLTTRGYAGNHRRRATQVLADQIRSPDDPRNTRDRSFIPRERETDDREIEEQEIDRGEE